MSRAVSQGSLAFIFWLTLTHLLCGHICIPEQFTHFTEIWLWNRKRLLLWPQLSFLTTQGRNGSELCDTAPDEQEPLQGCWRECSVAASRLMHPHHTCANSGIWTLCIKATIVLFRHTLKHPNQIQSQSIFLSYGSERAVTCIKLLWIKINTQSLAAF